MVSPWRILAGAGAASILEIFSPVSLLFRPSAGVATAALLMWGAWAWPVAVLGAVFAGTYLGHHWTQIGVDALADTGQAVAGWALVRRYLGLPVPLFRSSHLIGFHLLVGPVAATGGTLLRMAGYRLSSVELPYSFELTLAYSWIGHSFGAALATTVVMSLFHPEYPWNRRRVSVALPVVALLVMAFYARWLVGVRVEALESLTLSRQADQLAKELQRELSDSAGTLRATASFLGASQEVSPGELERFLRTLLHGRDEPLALAWFPVTFGEPNVIYVKGEPTAKFVSHLRDSRLVKSVLNGDDSRLNSNLESPSGEASRGEWGGGPLYILAEVTRDAHGSRSGVVAGAFDLRSVVDRALSRGFENSPVRLALKLENEAGLPPVVLSASSPGDGMESVSERYEFGGVAWIIDAYPPTPSREKPRMGFAMGLLMISSLMLFFLRLSNQTTRIEQLKYDIESRAEALRCLNAELKSAVEATREADRAKSMFLANISHEIRTPLNGILGLTRLVLDSSLGLAQREQLSHVELSAQNLLALFNNILEHARAERGSLESKPELQDLSSLLQETARMVGLQAEEKGVMLLLSGDGEIPYSIEVDDLALRQVLLNLLGNAVKFTPEGGEVELSVRLIEGSGQTVTVGFAVRDSGTGIAEDQQEKIFQPFVQAEGARPDEGSGLGLAISRSLVERMGGRLEVQSRKGEGSIFSFSLEFRTAPAAPMPSFLPGETVVRVEVRVRHPRQRAMIKERLAHWGFELSLEDEPPRLLVLDEWSLTSPLSEEQVAVAIVSFVELTRLSEVCTQRGVVPVIRPFSSRSLGEAVFGVLALSGSLILDAPSRSDLQSTLQDGSMDRAVAGFSRYSGKRALVVDDNLTNRLLATLLLQRLGFTVESFADGESALTAAREQVYEVALLDIRLPGIDGYQVAECLRKRGFRAPIIAATAHTQASESVRVRSAGINEFLTKPLEEQRLREVVLKLVPLSEEQKFQPDSLLRSVGGDRESALDVVRGFLQEEAELRAALLRARTSRELVHACHTLKGAVEVFGMTALRDRLSALEREAEQDGRACAGDVGEGVDKEVASLVRRLTSFLQEAPK